jgi:hypothetical protein
MGTTRRPAAAPTAIQRLAVAVAVAAACLPAAPASAGGWATVGVSPIPDEVGPGDPWLAELTILQHGRTPLVGVNPTLTIANAHGEATQTFRATATSRPGVYRARVVFPSAGSWRYVVDDDFSQHHSFGPVQIGGANGAAAPAPVAAAAPPAGDGGGGSLLPALGAAVAAGLLAAWIVVTERRRRPGTARSAAEE